MHIFDEMAQRYDTPQRIEGANVIARALRGRIGHEGGDKGAMDYGCGTGLVGLQLADCFESLLLVDAAPQMVQIVEEKIQRDGISNAVALCADLTVAPWEGAGPGLIFMAQVLLHIPDTKNILKRLYDALLPGGRLLIVDFDKKPAIVTDRVHNGFVQKDLAAEMEKIGYENIHSETFYHGKNIFMNMDASQFLLDAWKPLE